MKKLLLFGLLMVLTAQLASAELTHYYDFETGTGTAVYDRVGSDDGYSVSAGFTWNPTTPTYATSGDGGSYSAGFTSATGCIASVGQMDASKDHSIAYWVWLNSSTAGDFLLGNWDATETTNNRYAHEWDTSTNFQYYDDASWQTSIASFPTGEWVHVIHTYDESATTQKVYKNGVLVDTDTTADYDSKSASLNLGAARAVCNGGNPNMLLDELMIFDHELTTTEVSNVYNHGYSLYTDLRAYYSFDDDNRSGNTIYDLHNGSDATNIGSTLGGAGLLNEDASLDGTSDYIQTPFYMQSSPFTVSLWVDMDSISTTQWLFHSGSYSNPYEGMLVRTETDGDIQIFTGTGASYASMGTFPAGLNPSSGYQHIVFTWTGDTTTDGMELFVDGSSVGTLTSTNTWTGDSEFTVYFGGSSVTNEELQGDLDEIGYWNRVLNQTEITNLYNSGSGLSYYEFSSGGGSPSTPTASERIQQEVSIAQNLSVSVNSPSYVPVVSESFTLSDDTDLYAFASVPLIPTTSNTATCRITLDGAELKGSEASRSLTAGNAGNLLLMSFQERLTAGSYSLGVDCKKVGGGAFTVENTSVTAHILTTADGIELNTFEYNLSDYYYNSSIARRNLFNFTTSDNVTAAGLNRYVVVDYAGTYEYDVGGRFMSFIYLSDDNDISDISLIDCLISRTGDAGSTASYANSCYFDLGNETNNTEYYVIYYPTDNNDFTSGTVNANIQLKEFILHEGEINSTRITNQAANGTIATTSITVNAGHTNPDMYARAGMSLTTTEASDTGTFYLTADGQNSTFVTRTFTNGYYGNFNIQKDIETITGTTVLSLIGACDACYIEQFSFSNIMGYIVNDIAATPDEFVITAQSIYDETAINAFSVELSDGRSFSTTTGSISVPATGELYNITISENSGATIPYYGNATNGHNSTYDLVMNLTPYTVINASFGGSGVNNFTVNGTATTDGKVYLRIFNGTYEVNISDAIADDGTNLSDQTANITGSPYLESYTFTMLTANSFNFSIYDELTESLVTENMTIELITGASSGIYTTTNGTLYLELLTPSDYTIRYYSTLASNYTQRDYIQTLVNRQRYDISLYALENEEATDMIVTIKDTAGDPVEDATVKLLRYYNSCNCYRVVEMATTSAAGDAYLIVDAYDGHYKFAVEYNGETEFLSTSPENFVPNAGLVERTITINLGSAYFESFRELTNVARSLTYNNETKGLSFTWNDPSGLVTRGCLYAEYLDGVHYTAVTPACQNASTGSVVLTLNDTLATYKYYAQIETSTTYSEYVLYSGFIDKIRDTLFGGDNVGIGAYLGAGVIIVLALMFSFSAIAMVTVTTVGVIIMSLLGITTFTTGFITGLVTLMIGIAAYLMRS